MERKSSLLVIIRAKNYAAFCFRTQRPRRLKGQKPNCDRRLGKKRISEQCCWLREERHAGCFYSNNGIYGGARLLRPRLFRRPWLCLLGLREGHGPHLDRSSSKPAC